MWYNRFRKNEARFRVSCSLLYFINRKEKKMPSFTKKAILESFLLLCAKKPIEKITVRDVVDDCGVNRNTFYYYFEDIYAVLACVLTEQMENLPDGPASLIVREAFLRLSDFAGKYPKAARNLAGSLGMDGLSRYLAPLLRETLSKSLPPESDPLAARFLTHALLGVFMDFLREGELHRGKPADPGPLADRLAALAARFES